MKTMTLIKKALKNQRGISLVETVMAVAILGTAIVTFTMALSTGALGTREHEQEVIAQQLAQNQIEYTKNQAFNASGVYTTVSVPSGYTLAVTTGAVPGSSAEIQRITVTVLRDGTGILTVSDYKVNR
jgi:Tfp pilus assembly protein PilV